MDRLNSEGIPREKLSYVLKNRRLVGIARRINKCLLCKRHGVNEAGLCDVCCALLNEEELTLANRWLTGEGP